MSFRQRDNWGTHLWAFIHTITIIDLGQDNRKHNSDALQVLYGLQNCIPCVKCRQKYVNYLEKLADVNLDERMVLFRWSVDLHNEVNSKLNKEQMSYEKALEKWSKKV